MRAVVLNEFGPPANLAGADVREPVAQPAQAVVTVHFASITFVETQVRAGWPPHPAMAPDLPAILGNGVGGVVASVGDGVDPALVGRRVITTTGGLGGYAEQVAVDAAGLIELPPALDLADAVALLADGRTALGLTRDAALRPGETVLVEAAAGGVGSLLVQLARNAGARVVAAVGGPRKVAAAADLGADVVVDYRQPNWAERVRAEVGADRPADVVFDGVGGQLGATALGLVRAGGRFSAYGMASGSFTDLGPAAELGVEVLRGGPMTPVRQRELTTAALELAAAGELTPLIGQRFPLERAADAHDAIETRASVGKTLLVV